MKTRTYSWNRINTRLPKASIMLSNKSLIEWLTKTDVGSDKKKICSAEVSITAKSPQKIWLTKEIGYVNNLSPISKESLCSRLKRIKWI